MSKIDLLGLAAGTLTTVAFIPQVLKTWKTKGVNDISLPWLATFTSGVMAWWVYGCLLDSLPIILSNSVTFVLLAVLLAIKIKNS